MRIGPKFLIALGAADLVVVMGAVILHSLAHASQYSGLVVWVFSRSPGMEPGSPEYEEIRLHILEVLGRTGTPFMTVVVALAVSGFLMIIAGVNGRTGAADSPEDPAS